MGRGNGPRMPLITVAYYHDGYLYEIHGSYGPVDRCKVSDPSKFADFESHYKAWLDSGHSHSFSDKEFQFLMQFSRSGPTLSSDPRTNEGRKSYDFSAEKRRIEREAESRSSVPRPPPPVCYTAPYLELVFVEGDMLVAQYEDGYRIRLPL